MSEAQELSREARFERSVEQRREPMNKNWMRGIRCWTSWQLRAKSISIKGTGCKSSGCAWKADGLTSGDLSGVPIRD